MSTVNRLSPSAALLLRLAGNALAATVGQQRFCVINYHRVLERHDPMLPSEPDVATFRWQMQVLASCFNVLPLSHALALSKKGGLPPRAICITFDDGYRSIHDLALPVLKELRLPATVFVTSGHLGTNTMWNDRIIDAVQTLPSGELDLSSLDLGSYSLRTLDERRDALGVLTERSKYLPPAARNNLIEVLEAMVNDKLSPGSMLAPEMVVDLDDHGIEIGAHTVSHPILTSLDDADALLEIKASGEQLAAILGKPVTLFAYPNGKVGKDYDERHVEMVRSAGFSAAFTTAIGAVTREQDRYQLPRSRPWDQTPFMFGLRLLRWLAQGAPR